MTRTPFAMGVAGAVAIALLASCRAPVEPEAATPPEETGSASETIPEPAPEAPEVLASPEPEPPVPEDSVSENPEPAAAETFAPLTFAMVELTRASGDCTETGVPCLEVYVRYPEASGGNPEAAERINAAVRNRVRASLTLFDEVPADSIEQAADAIVTSFADYIAQFPTGEAPPNARWAVELDGAPAYGTEAVVTLAFERYTYTGGAHPNSARLFLNFDRASGERLELADVVADTEQFGNLLQTKMKAARDLPAESDWAETGYFDFVLPENFAVAPEGLLVHYNSYEIAPYVLGPTEVELAYAELDGILDPASPVPAP